MLSIEPILAHVIPFVLVVGRLAGLLLFSPMLSNRNLPRRLRVLLAVMLAAVIYPGLSSHVAPPGDVGLVMLAPLIVSEMLIGTIIGFIAALPLMSLDLAGFLMGHQMGMGLARVYNPEMGSDTDVIGQLLMYVGLATFVALGGLEVLFVAMISTFQRVPVGGFALSRVPLQGIVGIFSSGMELGVRVAAPVTCIIFLLMIAMAFVMKTMPQINILSVGFTVKILFGLGMVAVAMAAMHHAVAEEIDRVLRLVLDWSRTLA